MCVPPYNRSQIRKLSNPRRPSHALSQSVPPCKGKIFVFCFGSYLKEVETLKENLSRWEVIPGLHHPLCTWIGS